MRKNGQPIKEYVVDKEELLELYNKILQKYGNKKEAGGRGAEGDS